MLIFVIPAYNEEKNIGLLLENIAAIGYLHNNYQIIIVDDGSHDRTLAIVQSFNQRLPITVIRHIINQGVGAVFRTGFGAALKIAQPNDTIITMEADNTSDLAILPDMLKRLSTDADVVLASCYARNGGIEGTNLWRKFLSWGANLMLVLVFPIKGVKTYSSFYRGYKASILQRASDAYKGHLIEQTGFVCMVEVLVKMHRLEIRIAEVPMVLKIGMRKDSSKMRVMQTIWGYIVFIISDISRKRKLTSNSLKRFSSQ